MKKDCVIHSAGSQNARMGMGRRAKQRRQDELWIAHTELPRTVAHPFYEQQSAPSGTHTVFADEDAPKRTVGR
jgi:hypothetical protein